MFVYLLLCSKFGADIALQYNQVNPTEFRSLKDERFALEAVRDKWERKEADLVKDRDEVLSIGQISISMDSHLIVLMSF
jgi:hypothetical protein